MAREELLNIVALKMENAELRAQVRDLKELLELQYDAHKKGCVPNAERLEEQVGWAEEAMLKAEQENAALREQVRVLQAAMVEAVNVLGPDHFAGELEGLVAEGNEALRVLHAALADQPKGGTA